MYDFHYDYMKEKFPDCNILYMDTDSLIYEVFCDDFYESIKPDLNRFDTSDYPKDNQYNLPLVNKKKLGLMKDELKGEILTDFVGLRSKMYCIRENGLDKIKKSKGTKKRVVEKSLHFEDYYSALVEGISIEETQNSIRSYLHQVYSIEQRKIVLNASDDKRFILPDGFCTLPWGHYKIKEFQKRTTTSIIIICL